MELRDRFRGCLLGLACGDAVGTTVEFKPRGSFSPITDMVGGGPFGLQPGQWTDDTSMALCLATSLVECRGFDARDQMERYVAWMNEGYLSSTGTCFDIGFTTSEALYRFQATGEPFSGSTDPGRAGNGSLMRLAPVPLYFYPDVAATIHYAAESSRTTHGAPEAVDACRYFSLVLNRALAGADKDETLFTAPALPAGAPLLSPTIEAIARGSYRDKEEPAIASSGYVVDSLEAALWSFYTTDSYEAAILRAANLGDDADTIAAITGQIAGAHYGVQAIPSHWLARLAMREEIQSLADRLLHQSL
ncbi:MAG TPA: ADP-ribosylglycohydrolase family protein [Caldilineaceae bacterium]|nr:ADP-ribosylglycohydrolase family protein [Caldilineaceae bacterium]